jgi:hypothetical protein
VAQHWRRVLYPHSPFGLVARVSATHKRDQTLPVRPNHRPALSRVRRGEGDALCQRRSSAVPVGPPRRSSDMGRIPVSRWLLAPHVLRPPCNTRSFTQDIAKIGPTLFWKEILLRYNDMGRIPVSRWLLAPHVLRLPCNTRAFTQDIAKIGPTLFWEETL